MKALFLFLLLCSPALARIGETRAQCEARYGPAVEVLDDGETTVHAHAGIGVRCTYFEGKCEAISLRKMPGSPGQENPPFTEAELKLLMEANSEGKTWTKKRDIPELHIQEWVCEGLQAVRDGRTQYLRLQTDAYGARVAAKAAADKAAKDKDSSKGSLKNF